MKTIVERIDLVNRHAVTYFRKKLVSSRRARDYLHKRVSPHLARRFGLGYAPKSGLITYLNTKKLRDQDIIDSGLIYLDHDQTGTEVFSNRIMFPVIHAGKVVGFGGRTLSKDGHTAKYINTRRTAVYNKRNLLYGLHHARKHIFSRGFAILVEGYMDFLALWGAGVPNVVSPAGTAFTHEQAKLLARYTEDVYTFFDGDSAGRESATRAAVILDAHDLYAGNIRTPEGTDPAEFIAKHGRQALKTLYVS